MEQSEVTKNLINSLENSTLAQMYIGVKIRVCAVFNSHPEPGLQDATFYGEGFTWEDALNALGYQVANSLDAVVEWAKENNEDFISPIKVYLDNSYYYYITLLNGEIIYLRPDSPELYKDYCCPGQSFARHSSVRCSLKDAFPKEAFEFADKKAVPKDYVEQTKSFLNEKLKDGFNSILKSNKDNKSFIKGKLASLMDGNNVTKEELIKLLEDM